MSSVPGWSKPGMPHFTSPGAEAAPSASTVRYPTTPIRFQDATCSRSILALRTAYTSPMAGPYSSATRPPARPRKMSARARCWSSSDRSSTYRTTSQAVLGCTLSWYRIESTVFRSVRSTPSACPRAHATRGLRSIPHRTTAHRVGHPRCDKGRSPRSCSPRNTSRGRATGSVVHSSGSRHVPHVRRGSGGLESRSEMGLEHHAHGQDEGRDPEDLARTASPRPCLLHEDHAGQRDHRGKVQ